MNEGIYDPNLIAEAMQMKTQRVGLSDYETKNADAKDVAYYKSQGMDIIVGERIYYEESNTSETYNKTDKTYTKSDVKKGVFVNNNWNKYKTKAADFLNTFNSGPGNQPPSSKKVISDLQVMGIYATPLNVKDELGVEKTIGYELTNSASSISAKSRILYDESQESQDSALKIALGEEFALGETWGSLIPAKPPFTGTQDDLNNLKVQ